MKYVNQILDSKGHDVWSINPESTVFDAIRLMAEREVGALLVMADEKLLGIISERDYARKVILAGKSSQQTAVKDIMTTSILCVRPEQGIEECMALMTDKHVRHLPVLAEGRVDGMISIGDLVKAIISDQKSEIEQLKHYISGQ